MNKEYEAIHLNRDVPAFDNLIDKNGKFDTEKWNELCKADKFDLKVYAETLMKSIQNRGPLSIGLLGGWGTGKSSILNIFKALCVKENYKVVYFNAWKYADDSFRRQFLMELCNDDNSIKNLKERLKKDVKKKLDFKGFMRQKVQLNIQNLVTCILGLLITFILVLFYLYTKNNLLLIIPIITAIITMIISQNATKLFNISIPADTQIIFPEDFQDEFIRLLKEYRKSKKIVIIIDDIDRCPSDMILDIMDSLKNFLAPANSKEAIYEKCYFITAMDNRAVLNSLIKDRSNQYKKEDVLKFFDVNIRLSKLHYDDLFESMNNMLVKYNKNTLENRQVPIMVIQNAYRVGYNTPRKIKHFINEFIIFKEIIDYRVDNKKLPVNLYEKINELYDIASCVLLLKISYNEEYHIIAEEYHGSITKYYDESNLKKNENEKILDFIMKLKLYENSNIVQLLIYSKLPNYAINFTDFIGIENMLLNDTELTSDVLRKELLSQDKEILFDLFHSNINKHSGDFLQRILAWGVLVVKEAKLKNYDKLVNIITNKLIEVKEIRYISYREFKDIVLESKLESIIGNILPKFIENCIANDYGIQDMSLMIDELYNNYLVFRKRIKVLSMIHLFLDKLLKDNREKELVDILLKTKNMNNHNLFNIPSVELLEKIIDLISSNNLDRNAKIFVISNKYWKESFILKYIDKYIGILNEYSDKDIQQMKDIPRIVIHIMKNVVDLSVSIPREYAFKLYSNIFNKFNKNNLDNKILIYKACSICGISIDNQKREKIVDDLKNMSALFNAKELNEIIEFNNEMIKDNEEAKEWYEQLSIYILNYQIVLVSNHNKYEEIYLNKLIYILNQHKQIIKKDQINTIVHNIIMTSHYNRIREWNKFFVDIFKYDEFNESYKDIFRYIQSIIGSKNTTDRADYFTVILELVREIYSILTKDRIKNLDMTGITNEKISAWLLNCFENSQFANQLINNFEDVLYTLIFIDSRNKLKIINKTMELMINYKNNPKINEICKKKLLLSVLKIVDKRNQKFIKVYFDHIINLLNNPPQDKLDECYIYLSSYNFDFDIISNDTSENLLQHMIEIDKSQLIVGREWNNIMEKIRIKLKD